MQPTVTHHCTHTDGGMPFRTYGITADEGGKEVDGDPNLLSNCHLHRVGVFVEARHHHASRGMDIKEAHFLLQGTLQVQRPHAI